ncbi:MAG: FtsB family cell division protein, partial [Acidimicrobiales bacterium]
PVRPDEWEDDAYEELGAEEDFAPSRLLVVRAPLPEPTPDDRSSPLPRSRPRRRVHWGQLAVVTIVGYLVVVGAASEVTLLRVTHQANALAAQAVRLTASNRSLGQEIALLHERHYVDELARTELGYVSPGEVELVPRSAGKNTAQTRP